MLPTPSRHTFALLGFAVFCIVFIVSVIGIFVSLAFGRPLEQPLPFLIFLIPLGTALLTFYEYWKTKDFDGTFWRYGGT